METVDVQPWWVERFGDPCRECGYVWSRTLDTALSSVAGAPERYATVLRGSDGSERHPALKWSAKAYVFHVGDNLRIWTERLAGALAGGPRMVTPYDDNLLAEARGYERMPLHAALWSLARAAHDWCEVLPRAHKERLGLFHPDRGTLTAQDIAASNCHDVIHHEWDVARMIELSR